MRYRLAVNRTATQVRVRVVYQPIGSRFLGEILSIQTPAMQRFRDQFEKANLQPELVAEAIAQVR